MIQQLRRNAGLLISLVGLLLLPLFSAAAAEPMKLKVGVLKFGTVNWQLDSLKSNGFDRAENLELEVVALASKNATSVALQAGNADMIVSDWIWVNRQRAAGEDFLFVPYSTALGALVLSPENKAQDVAGLKGGKIGIAGGPVDKNWLLLQAWTQKNYGFDLADSTEAVFAAPPLLNEQLRTGRLDAVLTFWPFAARLEAGGATRLFDVGELVGDLGMTEPAALVGYVFRQRLLQERPGAAEAFFRAIEATNALLAKSDKEWQRLRPVMRAKSDAEFAALRDGFRGGVASPFQSGQLSDAALLFDILAESGGEKLVGRGVTFDPKTFWVPEGPKPGIRKTQ